MATSDSSFVPFRGAWQRISRATEHRHAIGELWNSLSHEEIADFWFVVNDDEAGTMRSTPVEGAFPSEFSLLLGELLYQLRAALDNVVYDAAIVDSGMNPPPKHHNLEFPICNDPARFKALGYRIEPLSANRKAVIEALQPYNTPELPPEIMVLNHNRTLSILNDWARKDRHRTLNVLRTWAVKARPMLRVPEGVTVERLDVHAWGFLDNKDEIASFQLRGFERGMKVEGNPDLFFDLAVDEAPFPCHATDNLGERLTALIRTVTTITDKIQRNIRPEQA